MTTASYRPEIDGLRAIAVLAVVLYHANLGFKGGFVGVDVFFVISGFLITGIIHRALEENQFSLLVFWERRIRRIFPALTSTLMGVMLIGLWILYPHERMDLARTSIAQQLFVANFSFGSAQGTLHPRQNRSPCYKCGHWQ